MKDNLVKDDLELFTALINGETIELTDTCKQHIMNNNMVTGKFPEWKIINGALKDIKEAGFTILSFAKKDLQIQGKTITINGFEVPEPCRIFLKNQVIYFIPNPLGSDLYAQATWFNDMEDKDRLNLGLVHLTKEAAIQHANALLSFTKLER